MALTIRHNLMAQVAQRNLASTYRNLSESVDALSSGLRINSADDDAAGLAVREKMRAKISALDQGVRNAQDAISMLQTFDGAAQTIDEKLIRMKELAEQAATGTYTSSQRAIMNKEFSKMRSEIDRIANSTEFNGIDGLNSSTSINVHFGPGNSSGDSYAVSAQNLTASSAGLGLDSLSIGSQSSAQAALSAINTAIQTKDQARAEFGSMITRLRATVQAEEIQRENLQAAESRISDVDVAKEMATMTRNKVLAQSGVSMLAQANTMPQMAQSLLGG